jgi:EAL domain-containing protein (putative c-di-GMP-specific phosphodiesterase class I)
MIDVVAAGVEDERNLMLLPHLGCDVAQGYHLSRPWPADEMTTWLHDRSRLPATPVAISS